MTFQQKKKIAAEELSASYWVLSSPFDVISVSVNDFSNYVFSHFGGLFVLALVRNVSYYESNRVNFC